MNDNNNQKNKDMIGTRLILNLPKLEPIMLGEDIGTRLHLDLPPLPPVFDFENTAEKEKTLVRKKDIKKSNLH